MMVVAALAAVSAAITVHAVIVLAARSHPATSGVALIAAGVSLLVLTPLAFANRRLGTQIASQTLHADGTLSGIGAATSLLALIAPARRGGPGMILS